MFNKTTEQIDARIAEVKRDNWYGTIRTAKLAVLMAARSGKPGATVEARGRFFDDIAAWNAAEDELDWLCSA